MKYFSYESYTLVDEKEKLEEKKAPRKFETSELPGRPNIFQILWYGTN